MAMSRRFFSRFSGTFALFSSSCSAQAAESDSKQKLSTCRHGTCFAICGSRISGPVYFPKRQLTHLISRNWEHRDLGIKPTALPEPWTPANNQKGWGELGFGVVLEEFGDC